MGQGKDKKMCKEMNTEELWKTLPYNDKYEISSKGFIRLKSTGHIWRGSKSRGYYILRYFDKESGKYVSKGVHILVYETFVGPIPESYEIHHIEKGKDMPGENNCLNNLVCVSPKEHRKLHGKPILMCDKEGNVLMEYPSIKEAGGNKNGIALIKQCLKGKGKTAYGYIWKYKDTDNDEKPA